MSRSNFILTFGVAALTVGCVPKEQGAVPKPVSISAIPARQALGAPPAQVFATTAKDWSLGDPQLLALIERGLSASPQLAQVDARLRRASAYMAQAKARRSPSLDANARMTVGKVSTAHGFRNDLIPDGFIPDGVHSNSQISFDLNWDPDLWGRNRAALAAATSEMVAARFDAEQARQLLARSIALAYLEFAYAGTEVQISAEAAASYAEAARLVRSRVRVGLDNEMAAIKAESNRSLALAEQEEARTALALARFQLAALVGEGPDFALGLVAPTISVPVQLVEGLGIDAVARRADIGAARARVEARLSGIQVAERDFYPNVTLSALLGFQALDAGKLFNGAAAIPSVTPAIHLPIFSGGRLKGKLNETRAERDEAIAAYDETIFDALRDAASALRRHQSASLIHARFVEASEAAERARQLADRRLSAQLVNKLAVIDARIASTEARRRELRAQNKVAIAQIELLAAIGGHSFTRSGE